MKSTEQRTLEWYRARLGHITGSQVYKIMGKGRHAEFTETGYSYLRKVIGEQTMRQDFIDDDGTFQDYLDEENTESKAMRRGTEYEETARYEYELATGSVVSQTGSVRLEGTIFASSPDGIVKDDKGTVIRCVEIKCPLQERFVKYSNITFQEELKADVPEYYWQCVSHMVVTGCAECDFTVYNPWQRIPLHILHVKRDEADVKSLLSRIRIATEYINTHKII